MRTLTKTYGFVPTAQVSHDPTVRGTECGFELWRSLMIDADGVEERLGRY
jgi:hypothetical protein